MTTQWLVSKIIQSAGKNKWQRVFLVRRDKQIKKLFSSRKKVEQFLWLGRNKL